MGHKFDFALGDTRGIRQIMLKHAFFLHLAPPWEQFGYPPNFGDKELVDLTTKLVKSLTGTDYKYVIITNGATQALNAFICAKKETKTHSVHTHNLYFFFYPDIIKLHGLHHTPEETIAAKPYQISIVDTPSNPVGKINNGGSINGTVWDAAY